MTCEDVGRRSGSVWVMAMAVLLLSSCVGGGSEGPPVSETQAWDSAGVRIVESTAPVWLASEEWSMSIEPTLQIGHGESDGPMAFTTVVDATRRADGVIVVVDGLVNELKFFSPTGDWLFTTGGSGNGPGEYRVLGRVTALHGDSIGVSDLLRRRFVLLAPDGQVGRAVSVPFLADGTWLWDGSIVVQRPSIARPPNFGPGMSYAPWYWLNPDGTQGDSIAETAAAFLATDAQARNVPVFPRLSPSNAVVATGIWSGDAATYQFSHIAFDGVRDRIVRRAWAPVILSEAQKQILAETFNALQANLPPEARALLPPVVIRDTLPSFRSMMADGLGNLWVQRTADLTEPFDPADWVAPTVAGSDDWDVFDPSRGWLGRVRMPEGLTVFEIGDDYVLGTWKDALDVDHVRLHSLIKPNR